MGSRSATAVAVSLSLLTACAGREGAKDGKRITVGFSMDTLKEERWQRDRDLLVARCEEMGARVLVQAANGNDALQNSQAENLLTQGVDVLLVAPHNGKTAATIVESAHRLNVPGHGLPRQRDEPHEHPGLLAARDQGGDPGSSRRGRHGRTQERVRVRGRTRAPTPTPRRA